MSEPFVGEIRLYPYSYAPRGWALCQGQILSISQNTALFSLIGTNFGGDGRSNFGLPNLQGRVALGVGHGPGLSSYSLGQTAGAATVALSVGTMAAHNHAFNVNTGDGVHPTSTGNQLSKAALGGKGGGITADVYSPNAPATQMLPTALGMAGGGQQHNNMQPYLTMNYCIALQGVFPQRP